MNPTHFLGVIIEAEGNLVLAAFAAAACVSLLRGQEPEKARLLVAEGVVLALSLKTGATLLKTLDLPTWDRIATFAAIVVLRTVLKRVFVAEQITLGTSRRRE